MAGRISLLAISITLIVIPPGNEAKSLLQHLPFVGGWFGPSIESERLHEVVIPIERKNNYYNGRIYIGDSKTPYHVIFGTSFSGIWLFSKTACENSDLKEKCKTIHLYDDSKVTNINDKKAFTFSYVMGTVSGYVVKERLKIGRNVLENQDIGIVTKWDKDIPLQEFDGYFGIQFTNPNSEVTIGDPFFHRFYESGIIKEMVYGIYLNLPRSEGQVLLGGVNPMFIEKEASFVEIKTISGLAGWFVDVKSVNIGEKEMGTNLKALIDPSDFNIGGNKELIDNLNEAIGAEESKDFPGMFLIDCSKVEHNELPTITIDFNGNKFDIKGSDYVWKTCFLSACRCYTYFHRRELKGFDLILGAPFLNRYYSKYDVAKKTISFVTANHDLND